MPWVLKVPENAKPAWVRCKECKKKVVARFSGHPKFTFCYNCGAPLPDTLKSIGKIFRELRLNPILEDAHRQLIKGEYTAAAREATIALENVVRTELGDDSLFGRDLMSKAFSFEYDEKAKRLVRPPLIKVNNLRTKTERNEQEGMQLLYMGLMAGARNVLAHSNGKADAAFFQCVKLIMTVDFLIEEIYRPISSTLKKEVTRRPKA